MAIKKTIRNVFIILFYFTGIPYLRYLFLKKKYGALTRVIVFHEIKDNEVEAFENKLKFLKKNFNVISPKDFYNQNFSKKKLSILLTFDDGYKSWLKNVVPYLEKEKISAIFFLDKRGFGLAPKLLQKGHKVGAHTINHSRLPKLSKEEMRKELENKMKTKFFAYPFGDKKSYNPKIIKEVKKAGYEYAFTILTGFNACEKRTTNAPTRISAYKKRSHKCVHANKFLLHRDSLSPKMSSILFKVWLYGSYDLIKP